MSQWIDRVKNHPVWTLLDSFGPLIDGGLTRDAITPDAIDTLERIRSVIAFCKARLSATEPFYVMQGSLDALNSSLTQVSAHLAAFASNGDMGQLNSANTQADNTLLNIVQVLGTATPADLTAISEAALSYRTTLEKYLKTALSIQQQLTEKNAENEASILAIQTLLASEQQRLATLITDQQTHFSSAQDKRATDFAATQADFLAKYTTSSTEQQTQFSTDQDSRRTIFSDFLRDGQQKMTALIADYDQKLKDHNAEFVIKEKQADETHSVDLEVLRTKYQNSAIEILTAIETHKNEVESLVGVIGNLGVTSGYKKIADHARILLYVWQGVTVAALVGLIFVAYVIAFPRERNADVAAEVIGQSQKPSESTQPDGNKSIAVKNNDASRVEPAIVAKTSSGSISDSDFYHGLATRIFLSLTFGIFAAYAGRQASRFFAIEQKNRKQALELEALGPFIEPLGKEDRDKFRVQIGDRSFGVPDHDIPKLNGDDPVTLVGFLKSKDVQEVIANQVKEALKGLK